MLSNDPSSQASLAQQVQQLRQQLQQTQAVPPAALEATLHFLLQIAQRLQPSYVILEQQERWLPLTLTNGSTYLVGFAYSEAAQSVANHLGVHSQRLDTLPLLWRSLGQAGHLAFFDTVDAGQQLLEQQPLQPITIRREQIQAGLRQALQHSRLA